MTTKTRHLGAHAGARSTAVTPVSRHDGSWRGAGLLAVGDVNLFVEALGHGYPLLVMHGGPSADHYSMLPFRQCADQFTVILYDHRCNGRSVGAPVSSMTWENLTADVEALRQQLGFDRWAVLGHSFGGQVALEYALRYPASLSHLVLLNTGGDANWARQNAAGLLANSGYSAKKAQLVRRWFTGEFAPREYYSMFMRVGAVYNMHVGPWIVRALMQGAWRSRVRPDALIFAGRDLLNGWTVMNRLAEIEVPTLVMAGRDDRVFPPECQRELAAGIPHARLHLVDHAGHNPHLEQTAEVMAKLRDFLATATSSV